MEKLRAVVVDDEAPARLRLRELLERTPEIVLSAECASGGEAAVAICDLRPDLLFLDVHMPVMDGFQVLGAIPPDTMPLTIFVTAYDRHALAAFECHALDYLLKPFSDERFAKAVERAMAHAELRRRGEIASRVLAMLESGAESWRKSRGAQSSRLMIRTSTGVVILDAAEIDWIEAAGVYVEVHVGEHIYLHRESMGSLEERLGKARFLRAHRSTLVNADRVRELRTGPRGESYARLSNGRLLRVSRGYRHDFEAQLEQI